MCFVSGLGGGGVKVSTLGFQVPSFRVSGLSPRGVTLFFPTIILFAKEMCETVRTLLW